MHTATLSPGFLADFCRRWHIAELAVFGSALGDGFSADSDIDLLATFAPEADWSLLDHVQMKEELEAIVGRPIDLVSRRGLEKSRNVFRRDNILRTAQTIYVAR